MRLAVPHTRRLGRPGNERTYTGLACLAPCMLETATTIQPPAATKSGFDPAWMLSRFLKLDYKNGWALWVNCEAALSLFEFMLLGLVSMSVHIHTYRTQRHLFSGLSVVRVASSSFISLSRGDPDHSLLVASSV